MSVRVRLTRVGSKKNPIWRVVVADQRSPRDGRVIEQIGRYNPQVEPSEVLLDTDRLEHWLARGAQPTDTVKGLVRIHERTQAGEPLPEAAKTKPKKKRKPAEEAAPEAEAAAPEAEAAAEEAPAEEAPAEDAPVEETAAPDEPEPPADEAPAEEPPAEEAPAEEPAPEDAPSES